MWLNFTYCTLKFVGRISVGVLINKVKNNYKRIFIIIVTITVIINNMIIVIIIITHGLKLECITMKSAV
jgi:ABC-type microcin C transport system permease subunit YejE